MLHATMIIIMTDLIYYNEKEKTGLLYCNDNDNRFVWIGSSMHSVSGAAICD